MKGSSMAVCLVSDVCENGRMRKGRERDHIWVVQHCNSLVSFTFSLVPKPSITANAVEGLVKLLHRMTPTWNDVRSGGVALSVFAEERYNIQFTTTRQSISSSLGNSNELHAQKVVSQPCSVQKFETKT